MSTMKEQLTRLAEEHGYDPLSPEAWALLFGHEHGAHLAGPQAAFFGGEAHPKWCVRWLDAAADDEGEALDGCPVAFETGDYTPERLHADLGEVLGEPIQAAEPTSIGTAYEIGLQQGWCSQLRRAARRRIGTDRPLVVGDGEGRVTTELRRIAAEAGVGLTVAGEPANLADKLNPARWRHAPLVLVTPPYADVVARAVNAGTYTRRSDVVLVTADRTPQTWRDAVQMGATRVAVLPDAELWLLATLADTGDDDRSGPCS